MKIYKIILLSFMFGFFMWSCKKESVITSPDARLSLSEDTLHFDTVFVTQGSTTQVMKFFNNNDQKLVINKIDLMGGTSSFFNLNVDGSAGRTFTNIEIEPNDSIYLFATVNINPNAALLPFFIRDSVKVEWNGNSRFLQLDAYGKNAKFLKNERVTKDSTWKSDLPIVILGSLVVNTGKTLTIDKSTQIFVHAAAPVIVDGTLKVNGVVGGNVVFQGLRIDEPYKDFPGSWPGIYFRSTSKNNILEQCTIKNSYQGVIADQCNVVLKECKFDNIYDVAIGGTTANINAENCLISNVGYGFYNIVGGTYNFKHCTFASISNSYLAHKNPIINLSNTNQDLSDASSLTANFYNTIIYGNGGFVDDEIVITKLKTGTSFNTSFTNCFLNQKTNTFNNNITFNACTKNAYPIFDSIDASKRIFSFGLKQNSPCVNAATSNSLPFDINRKPRPSSTADIGCYESY